MKLKTPTDAEILALFRQLARKQESAAQLLNASLARIEKTGRSPERDDGVAHGAEPADEIRDLLARVRAACAEDNAIEAALYALKLGEAWKRSRQAPIRSGKLVAARKKRKA